MQSKWLKTALVIVIAILFTAPPCWAKAKGYCFVIGYSYKLKKAYSTPVFMVKVKNKSFSDTEYVADVALLRKMEDQFQKYLASNVGEDPSKFTVTVRGAYKTPAFAERIHSKEIREYSGRKFAIFDLTGFKFKK